MRKKRIENVEITRDMLIRALKMDEDQFNNLKITAAELNKIPMGKFLKVDGSIILYLQLKNFLVECGLKVVVRIIYNERSKCITYKRLPADFGYMEEPYKCIIGPKKM